MMGSLKARHSTMSTVDPPIASTAPKPEPVAESRPIDRLVFFLSGFDPKGPAYYHRLMRDEALLHASRGFGPVEVSARKRTGPVSAGWTVTWRRQAQSGEPGVPVAVTRYEFLRWDDIVRGHWPRSFARLANDYAQVYSTGVRDGIFAWYRRHAFGVLVLALLPITVAMAVVALSFGSLFALLGAVGLPNWAAAALALPATLWLWRWAERVLETEWLLRLYCFTYAQSQERLPDLEQRLDEFARMLCHEAAASPAREILLVGYSTGSIMAATVIARAMALNPSLMGNGKVALLTLGHCTPLLALFPGASRFRAELKQLAEAPWLTWIDYSSPADMAAFALVDPWMNEARGCKIRRSPRFHATMPGAEYRRLRRDRRDMHLHYLRSPAAGSIAAGDGFDFFALTAGPSTLRERFANNDLP